MVQRNGWGTQNSAYPVTTFVNNRMQTNPATGAAMQYDASGNLTSDGQESFSYDATGQQSFASVSSLSQYYDGDGIRAKKVEAGVATYYVRSSMQGGQVQGERSNGAWKRAYVYMEGQMLVMQESGQARWIHQDPVTKSQRVTNSAGAVISTIDLDPWGGETNRSSNQALMSHRYTTYERDANGGDEAQARRYQSRWTRFSQPDPSDGSHDLSDPQTFNRYSYVGNDPVNFTDPIGLEGEGPWGIWGVLLNPSLGSGGITLPPHYVVEDPRGPVRPQNSATASNLSNDKQQDPNSPECQALAKKIANIQSSIITHTSALIHNPNSLPEFSPTGNIRDGVTGHRDRLLGEAKNLADRIQEYKDKCGGGNPPSVPPVNAPRSFRSRSTNFPNGQYRVLVPIGVGVGVGIVIAACIIFWEVCLPVAGTAAAVH